MSLSTTASFTPVSGLSGELFDSSNPGTTTQATNAADASPATRIASADQRRRAIGLCLAIILITGVLMPIAGNLWPRIPAFLPMYQTAVALAYILSAYLIFGHFQATGSVALLYLSGSCLYTAGILIAQFLSIPGMFISQGALIGGAQTTIWLWCFWHVGPSLGMLLYAFSEWKRPGYVTPHPRRTAARLSFILCALFAASILATTIFQKMLPALDQNGDFHRITSTGLAPAIQFIILATLVILWRGTQFRTVLSMWIGVALVALLCDNFITMAGANRLSLGWYIGRLNALISAVVILSVYLGEINRAYLKTVEDAKQLAASNALLTSKVDIARQDALTRLPGRELFMELSESARMRAPHQGWATATLFIDLDGFKQINDTMGHEQGDLVLIKAANALRSVLRDSDIAGRIGGDEFVAYLVAPVGSMAATATRVAARIVAAIGEIGDGVGCSVGLTLSNVDLPTALHQADEAMYRAKQSGKNRFSVYNQLV